MLEFFEKRCFSEIRTTGFDSKFLILESILRFAKGAIFSHKNNKMKNTEVYL